MRTTLDLDDDLMREVKLLAVNEGVPLKAVFEEAVRSLLRRAATPPSQPPYRVKVVDSGLQPGVDLTDTKALYDLLDEIGG
jgi:hypothetical protein